MNNALNVERTRFVEILKSLSQLKHELTQSIDTERTRSNTAIRDLRDYISSNTDERLEKTREDLNTRIRDLERVSINIFIMFN